MRRPTTQRAARSGLGALAALALGLAACADGGSVGGQQVSAPLTGCAVPVAPVLSPVHTGAVLRFTAPDGAAIELAQDASPGGHPPAAWAPGDTVILAEPGPRRVVARLRDGCEPAAVFDATYDVAPAYAPAAGEPGSDAVPADDERVRAWADAVAEVSLGAGVVDPWRDATAALGPADGTMGVVSLGEGGTITLTFARPFGDGPGPDLAVFENGFSDDFLELAWVEVSSDGTHFERFDSAYLGEEPLGAYDPQPAEQLSGLAGKYRQRFGTPFDLADLRFRAAVRDGTLDLRRVTHVRVVDIVGDGSARDSFGRTIWDPFPTRESAGFDLDAVAVLAPPR